MQAFLEQSNSGGSLETIDDLNDGNWLSTCRFIALALTHCYHIPDLHAANCHEAPIVRQYLWSHPTDPANCSATQLLRCCQLKQIEPSSTMLLNIVILHFVYKIGKIKIRIVNWIRLVLLLFCTYIFYVVGADFITCYTNPEGSEETRCSFSEGYSTCFTSYDKGMLCTIVKQVKQD